MRGLSEKADAKPRCENCRFYREVDAGASEPWGRCRNVAPHPAPFAWPVVLSDDRCDQFVRERP